MGLNFWTPILLILKKYFRKACNGKFSSIAVIFIFCKTSFGQAYCNFLFVETVFHQEDGGAVDAFLAMTKFSTHIQFMCIY